MKGLYFNSGIDNGFERDLRKVDKGYNKLTSNVTRGNSLMSNSFNQVATAIGGVVSVMAVARAGKELITFSRDLETSLIEVATISGTVTENFEGYKDAILELSTQSATGAKVLSDAFYDIVSAGYDGAAGLELLTAAEKASTAGFVDVGVAADGLTTVLNAWNKSADEAGKVSDIFFKTVEKGKTTFPELAGSISQVAPLASSMGISFEEITGAVATLTKQGTPTAQAFTQIRGAMVAMNEQLGTAYFETNTLQDGFQSLRDIASDTGKTVKEVTGRVEGALAVLATTGDNAAGAAEDLEAMNGALGSTAIAAEKVAATTDQQISKLKNNILATFSGLGDDVNGIFGNLAENLNEAFQSGQVEAFLKVLGKLIKFFAIYKVATIVNNRLMKLSGSIQKQMRLEYALSGRSASKAAQLMAVGNKKVAASIKGIGAAFKANPIGLLVTALTAAIPAIKSVVDALETAESKLEKITEEIDKTFVEESAGLKILQDQLQDSNLTYEEKKNLINQINSEYGEYLPSLIDENDSLDDINATLAIANERLKEQIRLKVLNQKAIESQSAIFDLSEKLRKAEESGVDELTKQASKAGVLGVSTLAEGYQLRLKLLRKNLQNEKDAYDQIILQISQGNREIEKEFKETLKGADGAEAELTGVPTPEEIEKARKDAIKALEVLNQSQINTILRSGEEQKKTQATVDQELLTQKLAYFKKLKALTLDQLKKLQIQEQIITIESQLAPELDTDQLDELLKQYQTYTDKKTELETAYYADIKALQEAGKDAQAAVAEQALEEELRRLDESILKADEAFQKWLKGLPDLAKEGLKVLEEELSQIELELDTPGLDPKQVVKYREQIKLLKAAIKEKNEEEEDSVASLKDTLELMRGVNKLASDISQSFGESDTNIKVLAKGVAETAAGVINLIQSVNLLSDSLSAIEKTTVILAVISAAIQVISAINNAFNAAQQAREAAYVRELDHIHQINVALIEQNLLYKEGNEFFADDRWGTALNGLKTYNQALLYQQEVLGGIIDAQGRGLTDKFFKTTSLKEQIVLQGIVDAAADYNTVLEQALAKIAVKTKDRSGFAEFFGAVDQYESLLDLFPDIIDESGKVNTTILESVIASEDLSESQKQNLTNLLEAITLTEQSFAQFGDYISSIFGGVGDEIASVFQEMYQTGAESFDLLEDSFSDMIEKFTREAIEFTFLQPYINDLNELTKSLGEQYARDSIDEDELQRGITDALGSFYNNLEDVAPKIEQAFINADKLAAEAGFESAFEKDVPETTPDPDYAIEIPDTPDINIPDNTNLAVSGQVSAAITEESASVLIGRAGAIMLNTGELVNNSADMLDLASQNLLYLNKIVENTKYLPLIEENTRKTFENLSGV